MESLAFYIPEDIPPEVLAYGSVLSQLGVGKAGNTPALAQTLVTDEEEGVMRGVKRHIRGRLHLVFQVQEDVQKARGGGGLVRDADMRPMERLNGFGRVEEHAARLLHAGDAKACHRLEALCQASTGHQRDRPRVNRALVRRTDQGARHHLAQLEATSRHVEVERFRV